MERISEITIKGQHFIGHSTVPRFSCWLCCLPELEPTTEPSDSYASSRSPRHSRRTGFYSTQIPLNKRLNVMFATGDSGVGGNVQGNIEGGIANGSMLEKQCVGCRGCWLLELKTATWAAHGSLVYVVGAGSCE